MSAYFLSGDLVWYEKLSDLLDNLNLDNMDDYSSDQLTQAPYLQVENSPEEPFISNSDWEWFLDGWEELGYDVYYSKEAYY